MAATCGEAAGGAPADPHEADAVVATVTGVSDHAATYESPPRVRLEVHEVLQGDPMADRSEAVWAPPSHDVDTGTITDDPRYKAWAATKMDGPTVGSRWILYGWSAAAGPGKDPVFHAASEAAVPFSEEGRARAVEAARELAARRLKAAEEAEANRRADARLKALWRLFTTPTDLAAYTAEADLIVTGRQIGAATSANAICVQVTSVLKGAVREPPRKGAAQDKAVAPVDDGEGRSRDKANGGPRPRYIDFAAGPALEVLMDRDTEYLLFLSDEGVTFSHASPRYLRIPSGDGVVIADEPALKAVKDALRRQAEQAKAAAPGARDRD